MFVLDDGENWSIVSEICLDAMALGMIRMCICYLTNLFIILLL
jgi:hypothetical protein